MVAEAPVLSMDFSGLQLPATLRLAVPLTDAELMTFSRKNRLYKIERNARGDLEIMSPVGAEGSNLEMIVLGELARWVEENGGVAFSSNGGFHLPDGSVLSPDGGWVSDATWEQLSEEERQAYPPMCPEFLMEVLFASDSRPALERKMGMWIANGAKLAWMIDPYAGTVSIYWPGVEVEVLERPEVVVADAVVPGFRLRTSRLWR